MIFWVLEVGEEGCISWDEDSRGGGGEWIFLLVEGFVTDVFVVK